MLSELMLRASIFDVRRLGKLGTMHSGCPECSARLRDLINNLLALLCNLGSDAWEAWTT